jgi:hypothetical protein
MKAFHKVRFEQSYAGGAMLAPSSQTGGMFALHVPAPMDEVTGKN